MNAIIEDFEPKAGMSMDKYLKMGLDAAVKAAVEDVENKLNK